MKRKISTLVFDKDGVLIEISKEKNFKKMLESGATIVEQGIAITPHEEMPEEDMIVQPEPKETENNNKPKGPYVRGSVGYYPVEDEKELTELYKEIKKLARRPESMDMRQLETIGERIKFLNKNLFYEKSYGKTSARLRKTCLVLWLVCGIINSFAGKTLLFTLNYLCAILQIDLVELTTIVMSSTISPEKKKYILENIKRYGVSEKAVQERPYVNFYAKVSMDEAPDAVSSLNK